MCFFNDHSDSHRFWDSHRFLFLDGLIILTLGFCFSASLQGNLMLISHVKRDGRKERKGGGRGGDSWKKPIALRECIKIALYISIYKDG